MDPRSKQIEEIASDPRKHGSYVFIHQGRMAAHNISQWHAIGDEAKMS